MRPPASPPVRCRRIRRDGRCQVNQHPGGQPARAASSAVRRTQWSVAMPTMSTPSTPRCRNHSSSGVSLSSTPSKAAVARGVGAFAEDRLDRGRVEVGMKFRTRSARNAMRWPGRRIIRLVGERSRVDVEILGRHDVRVAGRGGQIVVDRRSQGGAAVYRSEPPAQKSFCTSTMSNARTGSTLMFCQGYTGYAPRHADPQNRPAPVIDRVYRPRG